jgi:hypothetical protein
VHFSKKHRCFVPELVILAVSGCRLRLAGAVAANPRIYILLCMFNGFAFARPFCGAING